AQNKPWQAQNHLELNWAILPSGASRPEGLRLARPLALLWRFKLCLLRAAPRPGCASRRHYSQG
ncbi:hypothetical protein A2U01_0061815, partial [Trifolium medium]|nr:hypothetical protein [Trifolium medium]